MLKPTEAKQSEARVVSFRDPAGRLLSLDDRILRLVNDEGASGLRDFLNSKTSRKFLERGLLVGTRFIDRDSTSRLVEQIGLSQDDSLQRAVALVEHER